MSRLLAVAAAASLALACSKKEEAPAAPEPGAAAGTTAPAAAASGQHGATRMAARGYPRIALVDLKVEDVAAMIPSAAGGSALGDPVVQASGRQVRQSFCFAELDLAKVGDVVEKAVKERGFSASKPQPRGKPDKPRVALSGQKDDFRLSANILPSANPSCAGKTEVMYTFHRVVKREAPKP